MRFNHEFLNYIYRYINLIKLPNNSGSKWCYISIFLLIYLIFVLVSLVANLKLMNSE